ncbi:hypothetical protein [Novipirellula artificiosorum]|uniref:Uncharacterized protein n=1 Tax=Novipirellula artificiosorum TaxID=2528016 RepID=A0A5C6DR28_9BACT|nr:hypothetical protein [Novipirellula artificiosorum]TWU39218.1 hypothetical protein Poly41_20400 [Novipirellula artificiosorum]
MRNNFRRTIVTACVALFCLTCVSSSTTTAKPAASDDAALTGNVIQFVGQNAEQTKNLRGRLHACIFDRGENDLLYIGTKYGMWSNGSFDLTVEGKVVHSAKLPYLLYSGTLVDIGNVLDADPKTGDGIKIENVKGWFK